jgi:hypothetical protein
MKTTIKNSRNILFASFMLLGSVSAFANNDKNNNDKTKDTAPVEFRFVGSVQQQPVYQLDINHADEYYISFSDGFGTILYSGTIKSGTSSQRFMINAEEVGDEALTVTISSKKSNVSQVYTIKRSQSLVEENVIKRIK